MKYVAGVAFVAAFIWLATLCIELAWNALVPPLFHSPMMTYQQAGAAFILIVMVAVIFKVVNTKWS